MKIEKPGEKVRKSFYIVLNQLLVLAGVATFLHDPLEAFEYCVRTALRRTPM
jgi:hypothetical protein